MRHALERGEVSGYVAGHPDAAKAVLIGWLQSGSAFPILQLGRELRPGRTQRLYAAACQENRALDRIRATAKADSRQKTSI